jgi:hypothetical protein
VRTDHLGHMTYGSKCRNSNAFFLRTLPSPKIYTPNYADLY